MSHKNGIHNPTQRSHGTMCQYMEGHVRHVTDATKESSYQIHAVIQLLKIEQFYPSSISKF